MESSAKGVYYGYVGETQPNSDYPYSTQGQYANSNNNQSVLNTPVDVRGSFVKANETVAKI